MSSSVGRNSLIMASGTAASRVTGQIRTILLAAAIGTTGLAANAYQAGSMIPQVIYTLVSGGIFNAVLVPQIVRTFKEDDAEDRLNKLITFAIALLLGVTILMAALTPVLTRLYVNGSDDMIALTNAFTLWCMPQIFFYGLYTVLGQVLAAKNHFAAYAWSSVGANIISCAGFAVFIVLFGKSVNEPLSFWTPGRVTLTAGMWTLGVAFQALVLFIPLFKCGIHFKPSFGVRGIGLRSMGPVAAWSIGIVIVDQLANILCTRATTSAPAVAEQTLGLSQLDVAGNATYQNAYTIYLLPYSLIAVSVATAIFPKISTAVADSDIATARDDLSEALRNVGLIMFFFTAAFLVMPLSITKALLPSVSLNEAVLITAPLMALSIALPLTSAYLIIQRTFYAFEDGKAPFIFIVILTIIQLAILYLGMHFLSPTHWVTVLAFSGSASYILSFIPLILMLRKRFEGRIDGKRISIAYSKAAIAAVAAIVLGLLVRKPLYSVFHISTDATNGGMNWLQAVVTAFILTIVISVVYFGVLWLVRAQELQSVVAMVTNRFLKRGVTTADSDTSAQPSSESGLTQQELLQDELDEEAALAQPLNEVEQVSPTIPIELAQDPNSSLPPSFTPDQAGNRPTHIARTVHSAHHDEANMLDMPSTVAASIAATHRNAQAAHNAAGHMQEAATTAISVPQALHAVNGLNGSNEATMNADASTEQTDNATAWPPLYLGPRNEEDPIMKPHLGDTVLNRYTLISPLREEAGLQAWKVNDRTLSRDCQLFIVSNTAILPSTTETASTLATSNDPHFTKVLQLHRVDDVDIVVTQLDGGISISQYLASSTPQPLSYEAIRSIVGEATDAMQVLHKRGLTHYAISTDTVRLTKLGIQIADTAISEALADTSNIGDQKAAVEQLAVHQLAALLYCLVTRTRSMVHPHFSLTALPIDMPMEFYLIIKRGLNLPSEDGSPTVPMVTVAELDALLGSHKAFPALTRRDLRLNTTEGACSIVSAFLKPVDDADIVPLHASLLSTQTGPTFEFAHTQSAATTVIDASMASATPAAAAAESNDKRTERASAGSGLRALWNESMAAMEARGGAVSDDSNNIPDSTGELFSAFGASPSDSGNMPVQSDRQTVALDVSALRHSDATSHDIDEPSVGETTGRIDVIDAAGNLIPAGDESRRALEAEQQAIAQSYSDGNAALPPSFEPKQQAQDAKQRANQLKSRFIETPSGKKSAPKIIAIIVVIIALICAVAFGIRAVTGSSLFGSSSNSDYWPSINEDTVPFGSSNGGDVAKNNVSQSPTASATPTQTASPTPTPENTTAYTTDGRGVVSNPDGQAGYGFYLHYANPETINKVIVSITTSGGKGYIYANTNSNPNDGEKVAEFTFAEGGTTEVKLDKSVTTQELLLWVPTESLPGGTLYINSVKAY